MKTDVLRTSLIDALSFCSLRELPDEDTKEYVWLKAIALVQKKDGSKSYVILEKDKNMMNKVAKDFGNISVIASVLNVYPFSFLNALLMPKFNTLKKEERITWLKQHSIDKSKDYSDMTLKELNAEVLAVVGSKQLDYESIKTKRNED